MVESMGGEWSGASAKFYGREKVGNSMRASGVSNIYVEVYHHYYLFIYVFYIMLCVGVTNHMDVYSLCIQTNTWPAGGAGRREKSRLQYIHLDKWEILGGFNPSPMVQQQQAILVQSGMAGYGKDQHQAMTPQTLGGMMPQSSILFSKSVSQARSF